MPDIYDLHKKAFARVSAYVVMSQGERVATIAIKYPADGAGRLWAYVHFLGSPMVRAYAGGYGYDKTSAAVESAISRVDLVEVDHSNQSYAMHSIAHNEQAARFRAAIAEDSSGRDWARKLENAGFRVLSAV